MRIEKPKLSIIGLAVSGVKPAEDGNGSVGLNGNPVVSAQLILCLFPDIESDLGWFSSEY
jgi:hypothetical protein